MSALDFTIHSETPEIRKITKVSEALKDGAVILYPTDTGFSLGCNLSNKVAIHRIRTIRQLPDNKALTFLCDSLANIAEFAQVSNLAYKTIKRLIPGPYTFVLPASKNVPNFAQNPKRKTAGIRVPNNTLAQLLLKETGHPIISITAKREELKVVNDPDVLADSFKNLVDVIVHSDKYTFSGESTVIDMTDEPFTLIREGAGMELINDFIDIESAE